MTVTIIAEIKLTLVKLKVCTNVAVLFLFSDNRLKVKQYKITSGIKMTNTLKFKQDNFFTKYYYIMVVYSLKIPYVWYI